MNKETMTKEYIEKMLREYEIKNNCLEHKENFCIEIFNNIISEEKVIAILKNYGYVFLKKHKGFEINLGYLRENKYFKKKLKKKKLIKNLIFYIKMKKIMTI